MIHGKKIKEVLYEIFRYIKISSSDYLKLLLELMIKNMLYKIGKKSFDNVYKYECI